ncbi:MAG: class I SAM-dependent methyltransferase [Caldilineaceae bacterium]|nr:class I SAM-dependent methyltransferase [Caldilineaceae bacterium]
MTAYDKHYREENLFGEPYPEFVDFITHWPYRGRALDLGCGQGRDALLLAAAGFQVTAIDISKVGVRQMLSEAKERHLSINGIVADIYTVDLEHTYDLILFNSIFHFETPDRDKELGLLKAATLHLNPQGVICIFVHQAQQKETLIKDFFKTNYPEWRVIVDRYLDYLYEEKSSDFRSAMKFNMYFVQNSYS